MDKHQLGEYCKAEYFEKHIKQIMLECVFTLPDAGLDRFNKNPILQFPFDLENHGKLVLQIPRRRKYQRAGNFWI